MDLLLFDTPFGRICLMSELGDAINRLYLPNNIPPVTDARGTPLLAEGKRQLLEYFSGIRTTFHLPVAPAGTPFQTTVWKALTSIAFGETLSYRDIALTIGNPRAARAVGSACRRNPIPILIPCHRVISAAGALTGFAGGLELKEAMLKLER